MLEVFQERQSRPAAVPDVPELRLPDGRVRQPVQPVHHRPGRESAGVEKDLRPGGGVRPPRSIAQPEPHRGGVPRGQRGPQADGVRIACAWGSATPARRRPWRRCPGRTWWRSPAPTSAGSAALMDERVASGASKLTCTRARRTPGCRPTVSHALDDYLNESQPKLLVVHAGAGRAGEGQDPAGAQYRGAGELQPAGADRADHPAAGGAVQARRQRPCTTPPR